MFWRSKTSYCGKHVLITGGSTGIGLAIAAELVRRGAHITLIARTQSKLDAAADELRALARGVGVPTVIRTLAADTCNMKQVNRRLLHCVHSHAPLLPMRFSPSLSCQVDVLICCAGASHPGMGLPAPACGCHVQQQKTDKQRWCPTCRPLPGAEPGCVCIQHGGQLLRHPACPEGGPARHGGEEAG